MGPHWENLENDVAALKTSIASLRERLGELTPAEIDRLLSPLRACMVEMIALRSSLDKARKNRGGADPIA